MTLKEMAYKIEELRISADRISSLKIALFAATYESGNNAEAYEGAFLILGNLLLSMRDEMNELEGKIFESLRKGDVSIGD